MTTIAMLTTNTEDCGEEANLASVWFWKDYLLLADLEKAHSSRKGEGGKWRKRVLQGL